MDRQNADFDAMSLIRRRISKPYFQIGATDLRSTFGVIKVAEDKLAIRFKYEGKRKQFPANEIPSYVLAITNRGKNIALMVPACFTNSLRAAVDVSADKAGVSIVSIINEPIAAAIAYRFDGENTISPKTVLVFDLGGLNCEVSLLTIEDDRVFRMKSTAQNPLLGGEDFTNRLFNHFASQFEFKHKRSDISSDDRALRRLRIACERAKIALSSTNNATIEIDSFHNGIDFCATITRDRFERLNMDLFQKCIELVDRCLMYAKIGKNTVDYVVLIGGSSQIPRIQQLLQHFFNGKILCTRIDPCLAVKSGKKIYRDDKRNANKKVRELLLLDSTSLSLGIETVGGAMAVFIPRNTIVPIREERIFSTYVDNQTSVLIQVYQGERPMTKDNNLLAIFELKGITQAPRGVPRINVCFHVEANGRLNVSAGDKISGVENRILITYDDGRPNKRDIKSMVIEAKRCRVEDDVAKKKVEAKNTLENYIYNMTTIIKDGKISSSDKLQIKKATDEVTKWLNTSYQSAKVDDVEEKLKELESLCKPIISMGARPKFDFDLNL